MKESVKLSRSATKQTSNLLLMLTIFASAGVVPIHAQTQMEMNQSAANETGKIDKQMDGALKKLTRNSTDAKFTSDLNNSQALWKKFCAAHIYSIFPGNDYGSVNGMCCENIQGGLSDDRASELQGWNKPPNSESEASLEAEYSRADKALNLTYQKVIRGRAKDVPSFPKALIAAEKAWIAFRDADADAFAASHKETTARTRKLVYLTRARTKQLHEWLVPIEEGDVCAGSYPIKR